MSKNESIRATLNQEQNQRIIDGRLEKSLIHEWDIRRYKLLQKHVSVSYIFSTRSPSGFISEPRPILTLPMRHINHPTLQAELVHQLTKLELLVSEITKLPFRDLLITIGRTLISEIKIDGRHPLLRLLLQMCLSLRIDLLPIVLRPLPILLQAALLGTEILMGIGQGLMIILIKHPTRQYAMLILIKPPESAE